MEQSPPVDLSNYGWIRASNGAPILRYAVEEAGQVLHVEWQRDSPIDDVKLGFLELGRLLRENDCSVLLSSSDQFVGDWSDLIPWVRYEFLPAALVHGLRYLADVIPADAASSFSVYSWREETRGLLYHEAFDSLDSARGWVREMLRREVRQ